MPPFSCVRTMLTTKQTSGAEKALNPLTNLDENEKILLKACVEGLKGNITKGVEFAHNPPQK
jgi:malate dehydrogenase